MDLVDEILDCKDDAMINWNSPYFYIANTFEEDELFDMSDNELRNLIRLAERILEEI